MPAVIPTAPFETARTHVLSLIHGGTRLVLLTGDAGSGKSLLLRTLEAAIAEEGGRVHRLDRGDLLSPDEDSEILLVDEAARADRETLIRLIENGARLVLALLPEEVERQALGRKAVLVRLERLSPFDARDFLARHPRAAGREISGGARAAILQAAQGLPRWLAVLAGAAALEADLDGAGLIELRHARRAIEMHHLTVGAAIAEAEEPQPSETPPAESPAVEPVPVVGPLIANATVETPADTPRVDERTLATPAGDAGAPAGDPEVRVVRKLPLAAAAALLILGGGVGALLANPGLLGRKEPEASPSGLEDRIAVRRIPASPARAHSASAAREPPVAAAASAPLVAATLPAVVTSERAKSVEGAEPPVAPPETPPSEPPPAPVVIVEYSRGTPGAADAADRVAGALRARGHDVESIRAVAGPIASAETRHSGDARDGAAAIDDAVLSALRAYQPGARSRLSETGTPGSATIVVRVPDTAASAARPLRMDAPPPPG